jgi:hypothetical protein
MRMEVILLRFQKQSRRFFIMLEIGLLWADNVKDDLPGSVTRAARRYEERTGSKPNVAYVNQEQWQGECAIDGVTVRAGKVLNGCVFVGEEKE